MSKFNIIEMKRLIKELNDAADLYYNTGNTIMSDAKYDQKLDLLKEMEKEMGIVFNYSPTQKVGAPVLSEFKKVKHNHPMLSLAKCHTSDEVVDFSNGKEIFAMIKLDGLTVSLRYENGNLVSGETRGDGLEGTDITEHVKQVSNIPRKINYDGIYIIDGEMIILNDDFQKINDALPEGTDKFKNSRNLATGTLAQLDTSLVKERYLQFIAWDVIEGDNDDNLFNRLDHAIDMGFSTVPKCFVNLKYLHENNQNKTDVINDTINNILNLAETVGYPCDGVVFKYLSAEYGKARGQTNHHFNNAIAFKPKQELYETIFRKIEWSLGKTGILTPVAVFDPVIIDGTEVERASMHNISILEDYKLQEGDHITVYKANQIIPQIAENLSGKYGDYYLPYPDKCPVCGGETELRRENNTTILVCSNPNCSGKLLGKLRHFVSKNAMNIDGLSEATLQFLIDKEWVESYLDLYYLYKYKDVWQKCSGYGKRSVEKLLGAIQKSREVTLDKFICALSIPLIGSTTSKTIAKEFSSSTSFKNYLIEIENGKVIDWTYIPEFGIAMNSSFNSYLKENRAFILDLMKELTFTELKPLETVYNANRNNANSIDLKGKVFVITGSLNNYTNREELKNEIESLGGKVTGSVTGNTSYLINNDSESSSSKNLKAKSLNIPIITEQQYMEMIGKNMQ